MSHGYAVSVESAASKTARRNRRRDGHDSDERDHLSVQAITRAGARRVHDGADRATADRDPRRRPRHVPTVGVVTAHGRRVAARLRRRRPGGHGRELGLGPATRPRSIRSTGRLPSPRYAWTAQTTRSCTWWTSGRADEMSIGMRVAPRWHGDAHRPHHRYRGVRAGRGCERAAVTARREPVTMMDYEASITYTTPVPTRVMRSAAAIEQGKFLGLRCPVCGRTYTGGRGYCPIDASRSATRTRSSSAATASSPASRSSRRCSITARPRPSRSHASRAASTAPTSSSAARTSSTCRTTTPHRHAGRGDVGVGSRDATTPTPACVEIARPRRLDADRRARCRRPRPREQDLLMTARHPTTSPSSAGRISPMVRRTDKTEAQLLLDVDHRRGRATPGITRARSASRCAGSCDYLTGRPSRSCRTSTRSARGRRSGVARRDGRRVGAVRGVGAPAARRHRHRGRVRLRAVVDRRPGASARCSSIRTTSRRSASTPLSLRRAAGAGAARRGQGRPSARSPRSRRAAGATRRTTRTRRSPATSTSTSCSRTDYVRAPLRKHDLPPITDGAVAVVHRPRPTRPRNCASGRRGSPASTTASRCTTRACATSSTSPSTTLAAQAAGVDDGPVDVAELQAAFSRGADAREALGLGADVDVNPSGGPLAANPVMATGLVRIAEAARQIRRRRHAAHARALDLGSVPATEPRLRHGG